MYYFNHKLIERLPELFQMNRTDFCRMASLRYGTFLKMEQGNARCSMLVDLCNRLRISMSHFIVTTPEPERMYSLSDYQTPKDKWKDIGWNNRIFATLFRESGITGLYKKVAVSRMGLTNPNTFDYWGENPSAARMDMFIRLLNEFSLDATWFIQDENRTISLPAWDLKDKHIAEVVKIQIDGKRKAEKQLVEKDSYIQTLLEENRQIKESLTEYRMIDDECIGAENVVGKDTDFGYHSYGMHTFGGFVFHQRLWEELPEIFGLSSQELAQAAGLDCSGLKYNSRLTLDTVVKVCNHLGISVSSLFVGEKDSQVVYGRSHYEIPSQMFKPVKLRVDRLKYLIGEYSVLDIRVEEFREKTGMSWKSLRSMHGGEEKARVLPLISTCREFNFSPMIFFEDSNWDDSGWIQSRNERLVISAVESMKEIDSLREKIRKLEKRLKEKST